MLKHRITAVAIAGLLAGAVASSASAAPAPAPPPMPTPAPGATLQLFATGVSTPTAFAFGGGNVFVSDGTLPQGPAGPFVGGVYLLKNGAAVKLPESPIASFGVTWHRGTLYVSAVSGSNAGPAGEILAWSGWNGATFTTHRVIYKAPTGIILNGLAFGANGRLDVGVDVGVTNDHGPKKGLLYDVLSMSSRGKHVRVFATGMRQPWQLTFPRGSSSPFVTDFGQDAPKRIRSKVPDFILRLHRGQNYGFPKCNWIVVTKCTAFSTPFKFLPPHTDPGGLGIIGKRIYLSEFGFVHTAKVQSLRMTGGRLKTLLTGFKGEALIGLGTHGGWVYVGEAATSPGTGRVFRVMP